jgi:putative addiction module antidote
MRRLKRGRFYWDEILDAVEVTTRGPRELCVLCGQLRFRVMLAESRRQAVAQICYNLGMTKEVTLRQAGGSVSATLPKDMADRLRLEAGDRVLAVETDRGILLTPYDPEAERALRIAAKAAKKYRNALRELSK